MVAGLLCDLDHEDAARFSFLLATPVILAAALLEMPKLFVPDAHVVLVQAVARRNCGRGRRISFGGLLDALLSVERPAPVRLVLRRRGPDLLRSRPQGNHHMRVIAIALAIIFFVLGILYGMGKINLFTQSGPRHAHHITHLVILWVLALLCLIWARFQSAPAVKLSHIAADASVDDGRRLGEGRHVAMRARGSGRAHERRGANRAARGDAAKRATRWLRLRSPGSWPRSSTATLIPLAHPLPLDKIDVRFEWRDDGDAARGDARRARRRATGVEMEAMVAASVAALTIYDMAKALDKGITIESLRLLTQERRQVAAT